MSKPPCSCCNKASGISTIVCDVNNCGLTFACCLFCMPDFVCTSCGYTYCTDHIDICSGCAEKTCCYCIEKTHGNPDLLNRKCMLAVASSDAIAIYPLASSLPYPDLSILNSFSPALTLQSYSASKAARLKGTRPANVQAEHFVPNSCFITGAGRKGPLVNGAGNYSEGRALTYWVDDDQKAGTEHKYLTDRERAFCTLIATSVPNQFSNIIQWCDFMQRTTVSSIMSHRTYLVGTATPGTTQAHLEKLHAAQQAAYAMRHVIQDYFLINLNVSPTAPLKNGLALGAMPPPINVTPAQRFTF